jgi:3-deoxy-manno-octulosonate cytidylyltransferase (CMP-KDO synthetase)
MIEHVYRRACLAMPSEHIYIASGDREIHSVMSSLTSNVLESNKEHPHGMSRVAEAVESLNYSHVIILQADEILIDPKHLKELVRKIQNSQDFDCINLITNINDDLQLDDENIVKGLLDKDQNIIYLFRLNSKYKKKEFVYKIMGTIALTKKSLMDLVKIPDSINQQRLSIEQLKIIENDFSLKSVFVDSSYPSINTIEDIQLVKNFIENSYRQKQILVAYGQL